MSLTKTNSNNSSNIAFSGAAQTAIPAQIEPGAWVDTVSTEYLQSKPDYVGGLYKPTWVLALVQSLGDPDQGGKYAGRNGIYKWTDGGYQFQGFGTDYIGSKQGPTPGRIYKKVTVTDSAGKIVDVYYVDTVTGKRTDVAAPEKRIITVAAGGPLDGSIQLTPNVDTKPVITNPTVSTMPAKTDPLAGTGSVVNAALYQGPSVLTGTLPGNTGITGGGVPSKTASGENLLPPFLRNVDPLILMGILMALVGVSFLFLRKK